MIEENNECRNPNLTSYKGKTLLSKYEIPVDHLSYEYIEKCNVVKELEIILRILRSGEEGFYPDLIKKAEEKLASVSPNNRLLTTEEPALNKYNMHQDDWNGTINDLKLWSDEMKVRDNELNEANNNTETENMKYPPVRKDVSKQKPVPTNTDAKVKSKRISSIDYDNWNKYDADTEVLKMDLEDEKKEKQNTSEKEIPKEDENTRLNDITSQTEHLSDVEKMYLAEQEKNKGNELFKAKDYTEAIKYYTSSIAILPTAVAHNNRAMCYLKISKYTAALEDTTVAINMDPNSVKAYFRRALALQHKNRFQEALADIEEVLKREPNHAVASHIADELRRECLSISRKVRVLIEYNDENGARRKKIVVVSQEEYKSNPKLQEGIEVNEWGLPKIMCTCDGEPPFMRLTKYPPEIAEHILVRDPNKTKNKPSSESAVNSIGNKVVEIKPEEINGNYSSGDEKTDQPKRMEILEVENIEDECFSKNSTKPKFNVIDMRGKEDHVKVNTENDSYKSGAIPKTKLFNRETNSKINDEKVSLQTYDFSKSGAIPKSKILNDQCYANSKTIKTKSNLTSKELGSSVELEKCYKNREVVVANKYKNVNKDHSKFNNVLELETNDIENSESSNTNVKISPFQFNSIWISRRPGDLEKQAQVLRMVNPSELPKIIGNKLDEIMLSSIIQCLKLKFDMAIEKELVRDYLRALTNCERFGVVISFLSSPMSNVVEELLKELKPDESVSELMKNFLL